MKRVLLKLSGEALAGEKKTGFDEATVIEVAKQIRTIAEEGLEIGIVIGGGNFWRGRTSETIDRNKADQIGMLATVMNCIYVSDICRYLGLKTEIFTPFVCGAFTSLYSKDAVSVSEKYNQKYMWSLPQYSLNSLCGAYSQSNKYLFREMPLHIRPAPGFPVLYELYVYSGNISAKARFLKEASLPVG